MPEQVDLANKPYAIEYYYKAKWGHIEEFIDLFTRNHYPVLQEQVKSGRFLAVTCVKPRYHNTEDGRWDFRVTIVFKNVMAAHTPSDEEAIKRRLYPNWETFQQEELRRFEILLAHWDLPIVDCNL